MIFFEYFDLFESQFPEYKVKVRLRDLQEAELRGHYQRVASERGPLDYSLTSSIHPIYADILKFDKDWKIVQAKNRAKLKNRYRVKKTFGVEVKTPFFRRVQISVQTFTC